MPEAIETPEASYTITKEEPKGGKSEGIASGMKEMASKTKGLTKGSVSGRIGDMPEAPVTVEELTEIEEVKRLEYITLLEGVLRPHKLYKLATAEENRERMSAKLARLTLDELKAFVPSKYKAKVGKVESEAVPANIRADMNMRYKNISP